ncbi:hybrid sensor histidine kinase/response regulator [Egbenema bharatensis]|uniref:hybrid sensor histidine kinase/response regulator n=1 Tax=Egbenema bharatensis TaxID=3463334 RepID=UPI003A84DAE6
MSQDKELEIQLQFLDEAQEYLDTIEASLLGIASNGIDGQKINAALRAAHSVKGGAAMMGFQVLSQLAHRLEDSFKVLKVQKNAVGLDGDLEQLLLAGADCLRHVVQECQHRREIAPDWLDHHATQVFERLHDRLGDPQAEDANSMLSPEEGQDIVSLLFETEVEGCLSRLETVLQTGDPCLREEVEILAQELGGLGEMLQLSAFCQLCESVLHHLAAAPDRVEAITQSALQAWRQTQALVLTGNLNMLPAAIQVEGVEVAAAATDAITEVVPDAVGNSATVTPDFATDFATDYSIDALTEDHAALTTEFTADTDSGFITAELNHQSSKINQFEAIEDETFDFYPDDEDESVTEFLIGQTQNFHSDTFNPEIESQFEPFSDSDFNPEAESQSEAASVDAELISFQSTSQPQSSAPPSSYTAEFRISNDTIDSPISEETQENTVRVPVRHLNQLNDLMGELTIERNRLDLHLKRLRSLIRTMSLRVQVLDRSNTQLRASYDRVATQIPDSSLPLLPASPVTSQSLSLDPHYSDFIESNDRFDVLEMDRYSELHLLSQEVMETIVQIQEVTSDVELGLDDADQINRDLHKTTKQLQMSLSHVRMRPLSDITDRFPKALRELSLQYSKPVQLKVNGGQTLVDRNILEALNDPLLHLIRNAFDHGIEDSETRKRNGKPEQGLIEIRAYHRHNRTVITVTDDGSGIPLEKVRNRARQMGLDEMLLAAASDEELLSLIFEPGFSTTDRVTDLSGRGVGMDIVRNNLKQVRGEIKVNTQAGIGTTFTLSVPFTLSVARVLLAEAGGMLLAFPTDVIHEMVVLQPEQVVVTAGSEVLRWQDTMVQLVRLAQWLKFNCSRQMEGLETPPTINDPAVIILNQGNQKVGLQIDRCWGEQEVALRRVEGNLPLPPGFNSCTILGDGRVVPLVNISEMLHWIASCDRASNFTMPEHLQVTSNPDLGAASIVPALMPIRKPTILVVDDSINVRRLLALTLEKAGYQVAQAKDGQDAIDKLSAGLQVQAVICDIEMPRLDGYGFLAKVKATPDFEQLPVAMLTSRSGEKHRRLAMNLGATAYFSKPYNEQALLQTLEKLIELAPAS